MKPAQRVLVVLWPAFLMAGVLEVLVFAFVDPVNLQWFNGERVLWSPQTVHSVAFLLFWAVIAASAALTLWLGSPAASSRSDWPRGSERGLPRPPRD